MIRVFVSTTWMGSARTDLDDVLQAMAGLDADGIELGSTHHWRADLAKVVTARWQGAILTHNYFPPAPQDLILNLASDDDAIRAASIDHCCACIRFAGDVGATIYTVHPGYVVEPEAATLTRGSQNFDFVYSGRRAAHDAAMTRMNSALAALAETGAKAGVAIAVETQGSITNPDVTLLERIEDYEVLFADLDDAVSINFNIAHSEFAARTHGFSMEEFVARFGTRIVAAELSHNDGSGDQHRPLTEESSALRWIGRLKHLPLILEFRDASRDNLDRCIALVRAAEKRPLSSPATIS